MQGETGRRTSTSPKLISIAETDLARACVELHLNVWIAPFSLQHGGHPCVAPQNRQLQIHNKT